MQLSPDSGSIDAAIEELKRAVPIAALQNVIEDRTRRHKPRSHLRRRLEMLRALEIAEA